MAVLAGILVPVTLQDVSLSPGSAGWVPKPRTVPRPWMCALSFFPKHRPLTLQLHDAMSFQVTSAVLMCEGSVGLGGDDGSQPAPCRALGSSTALYKPCSCSRIENMQGRLALICFSYQKRGTGKVQGEDFQLSRQRLSSIVSVCFCSLWWFSLVAGTQHIWISVAKSTRVCTVPWSGYDDTRAIFSPFSHLQVSGDF